MKKMILLVVVLTLVAFVSGAIAAAPPKEAAPASPKPAPAAKLEKFAGDIKSVDAMAKSIVVAKGKEEKTFGVTADTKITKGKEALKFEDLKAGMNLAIEYKKEMDKMIAVMIKVSAPKAPPKGK
jgi:outer membrane lipoprotein-sorting protein